VQYHSRPLDGSLDGLKIFSLSLCAVVFIAGHGMYIMESPKGNILLRVMKCIGVRAPTLYLLKEIVFKFLEKLVIK